MQTGSQIPAAEGGTVEVRVLPYEEIARELTASQLATPADELLGFDPDVDLGEAVRMMEEHQFDYAPVFEDGRLIGRVSRVEARKSARRRVASAVEPLTSRFLISADSPIRQVMRWLMAEPWLLALDGRDLAGLVTPADLNRQPARVYFYMLLSDFEIRLADLLRRHHPEQWELMDMLSDRRRSGIAKRHRDLTASDVEVDLIGAFELSDLCKVAGRSDPVIEALGFGSMTSWHSAVGGLIGFRHQVMHPTRALLRNVAEIGRLVAMDDRLRSLLARFPAG